jgi:predicted nucleotidyltransferase
MQDLAWRVLMNDVVKMCKKILEDHYGEKFQGLVLYGSMAREKAYDSSDIDLLVLLSTPFSYFEELRRITDLLYPVQLESERLISAKPAAKPDFESGLIQLYRNAKREGIPL